MPKVVVLLIACAVVAAAVLAAAGATPAGYLAVTVSLAALALSVLAAFRDDIFPFRPRILLDEVVLAAPGPINRLSPSILLPLTFVNSGYGSGVIEGLTLKVSVGSTTMIYTPVSEIDYTLFLTGKRIVHAENIRQVFNPFVLATRASIVKCLLLTQEPASTRYPFADWTPGDYTFTLFAKYSDASRPTWAASVTNAVSAKILADYRA